MTCDRVTVFRWKHSQNAENKFYYYYYLQINAKPPEKAFPFTSHGHENGTNAQQSKTQTDR